MRQNNTKLDSFTGGGYSNQFKQQLDVGGTYDEIVLKTENIEIDQILSVEMTLNGDSFVSVPGSHFKDLARHLNEPVEANKIRIPFRDLSLMTDAGQSVTSLVTLNTDNLVLTVRVGAMKTSSPDQTGLTPSLSGYARMSAPQSVRKVLPRIYQENIAIGMTGENNIKTIATGPKIRRAFFLDGGHMTSLRIKRNNLEIFDVSKADNDDDLVRAGFAKLANQYIFSPIQTRFGLVDALATAGSKLEVMPTVDQAGDITVIMHTLENASNPTFDPFAK